MDLATQDPHELREHADERELDLAMGDRLLAELGAIDDALMRIRMPGYGRCIDCSAEIPFDRLLSQPQALRCIGCQASSENLR